MSTVQVKPNEEFLKLLVEMGISEQVAEHALICTGNDSVEAAMTFLYDNPEVDYSEFSTLTNLDQNTSQSNDDNVKITKSDKLLMSEATGEIQGKYRNENSYFDEDEQYKMVFVVNTALKMGVGKICSQVAHACLGLYATLLEHNETATAVDIWQSEGEKKVVLKATNHLHMKELQKKAENMKASSYMVQDAGRTEVLPGSHTVLAIFGENAVVDSITGDLSLL